MDWQTLLCDDRIRSYKKQSSTDLRTEFEKDYHRIIGSASFRRLQDKTQVFPLDRSDFIRTRLTHSLEVSSLAKSLGQNISECIRTIIKDETFTPEHKTAARAIGEGYGCAVLLKGGHQLNDANDLLYRDKKLKWFKGRRIDNPNTHGTGCTLSSAIASNLAKGMDMDLAVERAKVYLSGALEAQLDLGKGSGPMNHGFAIRGEY